MNDDRLRILIEGLLDERLANSDRDELATLLRSSATARRLYWEIVEQDSLLHDVVCESAGRDLARMAANDLSVEEPCSPSPQKSAAMQKSTTTASLRHWLTAGGMLLALGILLVTLIFSWPSLPRNSATAGEPTATLSSLAGEVWHMDARQKSVKATSAQPFYSGDRVRVGEESTAEVILADGTSVVLSADSVLHFQRFDASAKTLQLERGSADVAAEPQSPDRPLVINTDQARLTVCGTRFRLYAGHGDSRVELEEGKVQFERQSDGQSVEVVAGQYAVVVDDNQEAQPLEAQELPSGWTLRQTLLRTGNRVAFSHDSSKLATAGHPRVKVWDVATGELHQTIDKAGAVDHLAFTPSNKTIVAINHTGHALYWSMDEGTLRTSELAPPQGALRDCAVSRDGQWLAQTSSADAGYLPIWHVNDSGDISLVRSIPKKMSSVAIAATTSGPRVVAGNWNGTTIVWDAATGDELCQFRFRSQLHVLALSDDGRQFCGYGNATGLLILNTESGEQRTLWPSDSVGVTCLRFSRDGRELIAAMADGLVRGWLTETGEPTFVLPTDDARVVSLAVSHDGRSLATVADKGLVKLWQREE